MLLIILLVVSFITGMVISIYHTLKRNSWYDGPIFLCNVISWAVFGFTVIACCSIACDSYDGYLNLRADYEGVVAQYGQAIVMYEDKAIITINEKTFTDLRYQGYQQQLGQFISGLRITVVEYNRSYIKKSINEKNIIWGWMIFGPDEDMKLLQLNEQVN